jgi:uncharacterized protein (DUF488 family)
VTHTIWTVGHSTRPLDEFLSVLEAHRIEALVDVRRYPLSRRHPHFNRDAFEPALDARGIRYTWIERLGGRRYPRADSPNQAWRVTGFRGYADYMETPEFELGLAELTEIGGERRTAYMCAELLWWQCHRRLISDALVARGWNVLHIAGADAAAPHKLLPPAQLRDGKLTYAAEQLEL